MLFRPQHVRSLRFLFAIIFATWSLPAFAQVPGSGAAGFRTFAPLDTTGSHRSHRIRTAFRIYPAPLWSRSAGFAAGVGYEIENLVIPQTRLLAVARPGQHLGRYTLTYFVRDAFEDPAFGVLGAYYEAAGRHWYYGIGPASSEEDEIAVEKDQFEAEARIGIRPLGGRLILQPSVSYIRHDAHGFRIFDDGAVDRLSEESLQNLFLYANSTGAFLTTLEGYALGIGAAIDLRDRPTRTRRGMLLQGELKRYNFSGAPEITYDRFDLQAYGYLPIGTNRLGVRLMAQLTEPRTDAPIPFYLLPTLNGRLLPGYGWNRFYGSDLLVATVEYALPLFDFLGFAAMDGLLSVGAGNVYNDLFEEFKPAITFDRTLEESSAYPLRPSAAIGFNIESYDAGGWNMRVLLGWGTEGVRLVRFGFVHDLRRIEIGRR